MKDWQHLNTLSRLSPWQLWSGLLKVVIVVRIMIFQGPVSQFQVPIPKYFFWTITVFNSSLPNRGRCAKAAK
jgi:hypothetical protein